MECLDVCVAVHQLAQVAAVETLDGFTANRFKLLLRVGRIRSVAALLVCACVRLEQADVVNVTRSFAQHGLFLFEVLVCVAGILRPQQQLLHSHENHRAHV